MKRNNSKIRADRAEDLYDDSNLWRSMLILKMILRTQYKIRCLLNSKLFDMYKEEHEYFCNEIYYINHPLYKLESAWNKLFETLEE
ncbi:MAG: hypothetical protein JEY94_15115 [Melioribacteraceae bacterium]|nr:hypothetical protein [Melioribacteraceae bacterium]